MRTTLAIVLLAGACSWDLNLDGARFACPDGTCPSGQTCIDGRCQPIPGDAGPPPPWWDEPFATRRRLRIHNLSDRTAEAGLPVMFAAEFAELDIPGVDEMAIAYHDGVDWERLPTYWVYQERFSDVFWFRLPADIPPFGVDDGVWLHTVYPGAPADPMDGITVWEQHDYFDGLDATWETSGDVTVADDSVHIGPGGQVRGLRTWPADHAVDVAIFAPAWGATMSIGFQRSEDFADDAPLARWAYHDPGFVPEVEVGGQDAWSGEAVIVADERVELGVDRLADRVLFWLREEVVAEHELDGPYDEPMQIRLANTSDVTFSLAQLRVRRTMAPLPAVTLGEAEARP